MAGLSAEEALAVSKKYTDSSIEGTAGVLAGKNCTIQSITDITGGHRITFAWTPDSGDPRTDYMDVMDGTDGQDGNDGQDGVSPAITISNITGGHRVSIYDATHTETPQTFDVMDGTAATIAVGNVTSGTTASVTNSGTADAAVFDFVLPKGDSGVSISNAQIDANGHLIITFSDGTAQNPHTQDAGAVNGCTVVTLTQQQYEQLTEQQKMDDTKLYWITN